MSKRFSLTYEVDAVLTVEELWPDGDAPANPTEADVLALVEKCGGWRTILREWDLDNDGIGHVHEIKPFVPRAKRTVEP